jgi:hypothetical protein
VRVEQTKNRSAETGVHDAMLLQASQGEVSTAPKDEYAAQDDNERYRRIGV